MDEQFSSVAPGQLPEAGVASQWEAVRHVRAQSPLVFYALAIVAIDTLATIVDLSLEQAARLSFAVFVVLVNVAIIGCVVFLNIFHQEKLVLGEWSQLKLSLARFGTRDNPIGLSEIHVIPSVVAPEPPQGQLPPPQPGQA